MYLLRMKEIVKKMMTVTIRDRLMGHLFFMLNFFSTMNIIFIIFSKGSRTAGSHGASSLATAVGIATAAAPGRPPGHCTSKILPSR